MHLQRFSLQAGWNMTPSSWEKALGIDLDTAKSAAVWLKRNQPEVMLSETSARSIPSYAAFTTEKRLVGEEALAQARENPMNTIYKVKHLIGKTMDDATVKQYMKKWPFKVRPDGKGKPRVLITHKNKEEAFYPTITRQ